MKEQKDAEAVVREIRRKTRTQYSVEEKIRIVMEGLCGDENVSELCGREGISTIIYYK